VSPVQQTPSNAIKSVDTRPRSQLVEKPNFLISREDVTPIGAHQIADLKHDVAHNMSAMLTSTVRSLCAPKVRHRSVCARV
jgi:hypothetical protein